MTVSVEDIASDVRGFGVHFHDLIEEFDDHGCFEGSCRPEIDYNAMDEYDMKNTFGDTWWVSGKPLPWLEGEDFGPRREWQTLVKDPHDSFPMRTDIADVVNPPYNYRYVRRDFFTGIYQSTNAYLENWNQFADYYPDAPLEDVEVHE